MKNLFRETKGRKIVTEGGKNPLIGIETFCLSRPYSVFQYILKSALDAFDCLNHYMVSAVSKFNTYNNFNFKELPDRAANSAHWSGPLVAVR